MAEAAAGRGDLDQARELAGRPEAAARAITNPLWQVQAGRGGGARLLAADWGGPDWARVLAASGDNARGG